MKTTIKTQMKMMALAGVALVGMTARAADEGSKIGVVNLARAIQETAKGKAAKASLEKEVEKKRKDFEKMNADFQKTNEEFQKKAAVMSEKARMDKAAELQQKFGQLQETQQKLQVELAGREAELTKPILEGLRKVIPEIARKRKLDMVLESSAGVLLYAVNQTDLTEELIRSYDETEGKKK